MEKTNTALTPRQTDTALATIWHEIYKAEAQLKRTEASLLAMAGAEYTYRGCQRVTDMTLTQALERLEPIVAAMPADDYGYERLPFGRRGSYSTGQARDSLARRQELTQELAALYLEASELEETYTGWSRFFLVTSSSGHVHSSMSCSTCRTTTTYGWLPELSGKSEAEAVGELGPTLCSVCFPSAPVDWTTGKKITAAQAARKAA